MNYWILIIDSNNGILNDSIANKEIAYSCKGAKNVKIGDYILCYIMLPIGEIRMLFKATKDASDATLFMEKQMDVSVGCKVSQDVYEEIMSLASTENRCLNLEEEKFKTILKDLFKCVSEQLTNFVDDSESSTLLEIRNENVDKNYSEEELGNILSKMYNAPGVTKTTAVHMFGLKYGRVIDNNNYSCKNICEAAGLGETDYKTEVNKGLNMYRSIDKNEYGVCFASDKEILKDVFAYQTTKGIGINKIFYGVPGCGKSYYIEHDILGKDKVTKKYTGDYKKDNIIRTTFYQDYSNTDFVGQILPKIEKDEKTEKETVKYIFNPGPFTLALIRAISCPNEKVALIVEEINRGNAPAIFGDIFQLLDRDDNSISEYGITNVGVLDYLNSFEFDVEGEKKCYTFGEIKIPGNMDIFATMNTSDQNVYTLDTAFTRRWSKERMPNDFNGNEIKDMLVPGMYKYTWEEFVLSVNKQIQDKLDDLQVNEDKQVGAFFVKKADLLPKDASSDNKEKAKSFAYKVLEYLWDDVSKLDHTVIFNPSYKTFESLVEAYLKNGVTVFNREIFKEKTEDSTLESSLEE